MADVLLGKLGEFSHEVGIIERAARVRLLNTEREDRQQRVKLETIIRHAVGLRRTMETWHSSPVEVRTVARS